MRRTKDDQPQSAPQQLGGQQMGGASGDTRQPQQQQGAASGTKAPAPIRYTDWASI